MILLAALLFQDVRIEVPTDVPAITIIVPAPYPCNIRPKSDGFVVTASCITGPEIRYTCADKQRVLMTSEDGVRHCILFPKQVVISGSTVYASPASK